MPKKKRGKAAKNDARGYGQQQTPIPKPTKEVKTHNVQDVLQALSELVKPTSLPPSVLHPRDVARYRRKLEATHDALISDGFRLDQIEAAVASVGARILDDEASCLDWLCTMLPIDELPHVFTEGEVREQLKEKDVKLEVMVATKQATDDTASQLQPPTPPPEPHFARPIDTAKEEQDQEGIERHKEWIMSQYQYEEMENYSDSEVQTVPVNFSRAVETTSKVKEKSMIEERDNEEVELEEDPELTSLRSELVELQADAANEANNYMRSKQEIKNLQKQIKSLKARVSKLEARKQKQTTAPEPQHGIEDEDQDDCPAIDLFGTLDETDPVIANLNLNGSRGKEEEEETKAVNEEDIDLNIPSDCIPRSWTGATPRQLLDEWCKQNRIERPKIRALNQKHGCQLFIKNPHVELRHTVGPFNTLQHYISLLALYRIDPSLQLYLRCSPFFKDLWLIWLDKTRAKNDAKLAAAEADKHDLINHLMKLVPLQREENLNTVEPIYQISSTTTKASEPDLNGCNRATIEWERSAMDMGELKPTPAGIQMRKEWRRRKDDSAQYKHMLKARQELPIHKCKSEILDLVARNSVTILCAETGMNCASRLLVLKHIYRKRQNDAVFLVHSRRRTIRWIWRSGFDPMYSAPPCGGNVGSRACIGGIGR